MADKLVCARALSAVVVAAGTDFSRRCSLCGQNVCVAPTSQTVLASNPTLQIVCMDCLKVMPGDEWVLPPGMIEEAIATLRKHKLK